MSRSGFYEWRGRAPSARQVADEQLAVTITEVHAASRGTYGAPRVHAELRLGLGVACGRKRVARLMRTAGLAGVCHRRKHRRAGPLPAVHADLVQRRFVADAPDRLWVTDITEGGFNWSSQHLDREVWRWPMEGGSSRFARIGGRSRRRGDRRWRGGKTVSGSGRRSLVA